ncbi:hypothetical protein BJF85_15065 [Saccharomonospora sp. CUA-673]|nr:hypothetical protein BJF85_15065 [Saccharomonospora sp. CUA-673]
MLSPSNSTPIHDTTNDAVAMNTIPTSPPRYSTGLVGIPVGGPLTARDTSQASTSTVVPAVKLTSAATSELPATAPTCPLNACCTAMPAPATNGSTSIAIRPASTWPAMSPANAPPTAATVSAAPVIRSQLVGSLPEGPRPYRSTNSPLTVCPATTPTVNRATPMTATVRDWPST